MTATPPTRAATPMNDAMITMMVSMMFSACQLCGGRGRATDVRGVYRGCAGERRPSASRVVSA